MKKLITLLMAIMVLLGAIGLASGEATQAPAAEESVEDYGAVSALEKDTLTLEEMLAYAIQDEYLARQEYALIMQAYGEQQPFSNIISAEETHIKYLTEIYEKYNLVMPEDTSAEHVVLPESLALAMEIGVKAEVDNIAMYEKFLATELPDDVRAVFVELMNGSESHLAAFEKGERGTGNGTGESSGDGEGKGTKNGNGAGNGEGTGNTEGQGSGNGQGQGTGKGAGQGAGKTETECDTDCNVDCN